NLITPSELPDIPDLVSTLVNHTDLVSQFLWNSFSAADQATLMNPASTTAQLQTVLLTELNGILSSGASIYNPTTFANVTLGSDTQAQIAALGNSTYPQLLASDITDPTGLAQRLVNHGDPVSSFLWSQFSAADQNTLSSSTATTDQKTAVIVA